MRDADCFRLTRRLLPQIVQPRLRSGTPGILWRRNPQVLFQMIHSFLAAAGFRQHPGCKQMRFGDLRRRALEVGEGVTVIAGLGQQGGRQNQMRAGLGGVEFQCPRAASPASR